MPANEEPPIELEPRRPFSWKVIGVLVVLWIAALVAAVVLRQGTIRLLLPALAAGLILYLGGCTLVWLRRRR